MISCVKRLSDFFVWRDFLGIKVFFVKFLLAFFKNIALVKFF